MKLISQPVDFLGINVYQGLIWERRRKMAAVSRWTINPDMINGISLADNPQALYLGT